MHPSLSDCERKIQNFMFNYEGDRTLYLWYRSPAPRSLGHTPYFTNKTLIKKINLLTHLLGDKRVGLKGSTIS